MKWRFDYLLTILLGLLVMIAPVLAQDSSGQVGIIGNDGNIYLYDVATETLEPVTSDANLSRTGRAYTWPTWSTDGQLAFFGSSQTPDNEFGLGVFIKPVGREAKGVFSTSDEAFTYAYWSPADCGTENCRDLMLLYSNTDGLATRIIRSGNDFPVREVAAGSPFYWDWSPDGTEMLWARFGQSFERYDVASNEVTSTLDYQQGVAQSAVDWSPIDDRLLMAVAGQRGTVLLILDDKTEIILASELQRGVAFEWSPTGDQVAYLDWSDGALTAVDATNGTVIAEPGTGVIAFFWSPDGRKLAFLTFGSGDPNPGAKVMAQDLPTLRWNIYDFDLDKTRVYTSFIPSANMIYYLNFFDQFSRSHRLWSPDSRYLVYGETVSGGDIVTLLDTENAQDSISITEGNMGIFSWN